MCGWSGKMPCVCQEEGSGKTSNRKRNRKKKRKTWRGKKKKKKKQKQKQKTNTNAENTNWNPTLLAGRALREETGPPSCPHDEIGHFFQRCCSRVASRETACQGNSIPRETGEWKTVLNYMGVGAIYRRKKGCDHRPRTVLNTSGS